MKKGKRILSLLLILTMTFTLLPLQAFATEPQSETSVNASDLTVEGTNGFGTLLSQEIQKSQDESASAAENYEEGYSIINLIFDGAVATVEYSSLEEAILVVALYSEDGLKMLTSVDTMVSSEEELTTVTIEGDMPEYFGASAYLLDTYDMSPLCEPYDTPMYTREMQELLKSTVDDYDQDKLFNLDEDKTTNFVVYADETIIIDFVDGINTVVKVDEENGVYVIENADEQIRSLSQGDIFVYHYGENEVLIVKVADININGTTVTITGAELEMEEVFSYVKLESDTVSGDMTMIEGTGDEGFTYVGVTEEDEILKSRAVEGDTNVKMYHKFAIDKTFSEDHYGGNEGGEVPNKVKVEGSLKIGLQFGFSYYATLKQQHVKFTAKTSVDIKIGVNAELNKCVCKLPSFGVSPVAGVYLGINPQLELQFSGAIAWDASYSFNLGFSYSTGKGWKNLTKAPKFKSEIKVEGKIFFGIDLNPSIEVIGGKVMDVDLSDLVGVEINGELRGSALENKDADISHDCLLCVQGDVNLKAELSVKISFLKCKDLTVSADIIKAKYKLFDFYSSLSNGTYGFKNCPHIKYKILFEVRNGVSLLMKDTEIFKKNGTSLGKTNNRGILIAWLPAGKTTVKTMALGETLQKTVDIKEDDAGSKMVLKFGVEVSAKDYLTGAKDCVDDTVIVIAYGKCGENVNWSLNNSGALVISGTGAMWDFSEFASDVPWYDKCKSVTSVIVGNGITSIGDYAFYHCSSLSNVSLGNNITTIGDYAFYGCSSLSNVSLGNNITTIGSAAFASCHSLNGIEIPARVTTIPDYAFAWCYGLTNVGISANVTTIGADAFTSCNSLKSVTIPDSVTQIEGMAFSYCENLTNIFFRGNAPYFGSEPFYGVTATAYYPNGNSTWTADVMQDCSGSNITWKTYSLNRSGELILNEAEVVNNVVTTDSCFQIIPSEDLETGNNRDNHISLSGVYDGDYSTVATDTYILKTASFSGLVPGEQYVLLAMINIEQENPLAADNLLYIDQTMAFEDGTLVFQYVQRTPIEISYVVVCGASNKDLNDAEITFPEMIADGETQIVDPTVVYDGKTLTEGIDYTIYGTVSFTERGSYTCYIRGVRNYTGLVECNYIVGPFNEVAAGTCGNILTWSLYDNGLLTISGSGAMTKFSSLNSVPWYDKRSSIVSVIINEGVSTISDLAFYECSNLINVTIPDSVTTIGALVFYECSNLTNVTLPNSVTTIGDYAFGNCSSLTSVTIPDSITSIEEGTFEYCGSMTNLTIGKNVTVIKYGAFEYCESLISVTIPDGVTTIGNEAFKYCNSLTKVTIPNSVTTIGNGVFNYCSSLKSVTIPDSVTTIGFAPFGFCTSLIGIDVDENNKNYFSDDKGVLFDKDRVELIQAPGAISGSYEIPNSVTNIGNYAFSGCTNLTSVIIPDSITAIGDYIFSGCTNLMEMTIPDSVTTIGDYAFSGCTNLTSTSVSRNIISIDDFAFADCSRMTSIYFNGRAPEFGVAVFRDVKATAYYPSYNNTWTDAVMKNYGGDITWSINIELGYMTGLEIVSAPTSGFIGEDFDSSKLSVELIYSNGLRVAVDNAQLTISEIDTNTSGEKIVTVSYGGFSSEFIYLVYAESQIMASGTWGTGGTWSLNGECTLAIEGNGEVNETKLNYNVPWKEYSGIIKKVLIGNEITSVDGNLFSWDYNSLEAFEVERNNALLMAEDGVLFATNDYDVLAWDSKNEITLIAYPAAKQQERYYVPYGTDEIASGAFGDELYLEDIVVTRTVLNFYGSINKEYTNIKNIYFQGDATVEKMFGWNTTVNVYYPSNNATWTDGVKQQYDNENYNITWYESEVIKTDFSKLKFYIVNLTTGEFEDRVVSNEYGDINDYSYGLIDGFEIVPVGYSISEDKDFGLCNVELIMLDDNDDVYPHYIEHEYYEGNTFKTVMNIACEIKEGIIATLDNTGAVLTIEGNGRMPEDANGYWNNPWSACSQEITKVVIEEGITYITRCAFCWMNALESVDLPETLKEIEEGAFSGCKNLESVILPSSLEYIGNGAFSECQSLKGEMDLSGCSNLTSIPNELFYQCKNLKGVILPNSITEIGESAFEGCNDMSTFSMPSNIEKIGDRAFCECSQIEDVTFTESLVEIGERAFWNCDSMNKELLIGRALKVIGESAFWGCDSLPGFAVDEGNEYYSSVDGILYNKNQTNLIICPGAKAGVYVMPNSVEAIEASAFRDTKKLEMVILNDKIESIASGTFANSSLSVINIPNNVRDIGSYAFSNCDNLTYIEIPSGVTEISEGVFEYCNELEIVKLPKTVNIIEMDAFNGCSSLKEIELPSNLERIEMRAFYECNSLTEMTIPKQVTYLGNSVLGLCEQLKDIYFTGNAPTFDENAFLWVTNLTSVYYPQDDSTWSNTISRDYGGNVIWVPYISEFEVPGDANGDGIVDTKDVTYIRRFIVGGYNVTVDQVAADVNNDGVVDTKDVTLIRRYIVGGYGVELK